MNHQWKYCVVLEWEWGVGVKQEETNVFSTLPNQVLKKKDNLIFFSRIPVVSIVIFLESLKSAFWAVGSDSPKKDYLFSSASL